MSEDLDTKPSFGLYGEPEADLETLLHIETIAARSALHDWEIKQHRHPRSVQILLVLSGQVDAIIDGLEDQLFPPLYFCIPQSAVHGFRFEPETKGFVITLSVDFLTRISDRADPLLALLTKGGSGRLPPDALARVEWLAVELLENMSSWPRDNRLAGNLFEVLLRMLPPQALSSRLEPRIVHFRQLIESHLTQHRSVEFYAAEMEISVRSLGRLCSRHLGCSPRQAINRRLVAEAYRMLHYANASVVQVSDALGFKDPSYFSRFFKREAAQRPNEVRMRSLPN